MSLYGLLKIKQEPSLHDIEDAFDGNLCRCTGYRSILESARTFVKKDCKQEHTENKCSSKLVDFSHFKEYDPNMDVPFPTNLIELKQNKMAIITDLNSFWIKPSNLDELLHIKTIYPNAKIVSGNSEVGVEMRFKGMDYNCFIYVGDVNELQSVQIKNKNALQIGVNITLNELSESLNNFLDITQQFNGGILATNAQIAGGRGGPLHPYTQVSTK